jgi:hypothetical protein
MFRATTGINKHSPYNTMTTQRFFRRSLTSRAEQRVRMLFLRLLYIMPIEEV